MLGPMFFPMHYEDVYKTWYMSFLYYKCTEVLGLKNGGTHKHRTGGEGKELGPGCT